MAAINDLIRQIEDNDLRDRLQQEVVRLSKQKKFGLVFEDHVPECTPLYDVAVRKGSLVAVKGEDIRDVYFVSAISDKTAAIVNKATGEMSEHPLETLVAVAKFGEPIFPFLIPVDSIANAPDSRLWHTLIEADNFHALQLLEYLYPKQVDCIYIDPPYNTGARDWKYNNDYVDATDSYRHSKWLSMMHRRLKIAKRLLNPENSVLIVTIDEKEYVHLGCLLEEMFPEARIQMISTVINPKGNRRDNEFSRCEEYIYFVYIGIAAIISNGTDMLRESEGALGSGTDKTVRLRALLRQASNHGKRTDRPNLFYPLLFERNTGKFVGHGPVLGITEDRKRYTPPEGTVAMWPIGANGAELTWNLQPTTLMDKHSQHFLSFGRWDGEKRTGYYLSESQEENFKKGLYNVIGQDQDGAYIIELKSVEDRDVRPMTIWNKKSHSASEYGTTLLNNIFHDRRFSFPKSLYAVRDTMRFFLADKPNALIVDFFAGSGTTLHAVNLLNAEDGGNRRCIMVTNNEISDDEAKALKKQGYQPGDEEWEKLGIARYVTWPRTVCSIKGVDINGDKLKGNYGCEIEKMVEVDGEITDPETGKKLRGTFYKKEKEAIYPALSKIKMADGFAANAEYFKLGFLDKSSVELGASFKSIIPMLWLQSGAVGKCPELSDEELPEIFIPENGSFAVLLEEYAFSNFKQALKTNPNITHAYIVTNSHIAFREMASQLTVLAVKQLYRDYIDNFTINARRNNI